MEGWLDFKLGMVIPEHLGTIKIAKQLYNPDQKACITMIYEIMILKKMKLSAISKASQYLIKNEISHCKYSVFQLFDDIIKKNIFALK